MKRRLLSLFAVIATVLVATTALAIPSWAASDPVFTVPTGLVTRMDMPLDFSGASVTSPQGEDLAVFITADHGEVEPQGAGTPLCDATPTPGQLCFFTDPSAVGALNFRGTESQVNNVMSGLTYIPNTGFPSPGAGTLNDTMHFSATEQDIPAGRSSGIISTDVRVEPDNEAPLFTTIPDALTGVQTDVNQAYDFINDVEVDDPDQYPCDNVTPDVRTSTFSTAGGGTLATDYVSFGFQALGNGTSTVVLTGSLVDINNAYDAMTYTPMANTAYTDLITVFFDDAGCAGYGGPLTTTGAFPLEVVPGPATHFSVVIPPLADNGTATAATVTALDADEAVANDYAGTVTFSSSDASASLPPDSPLVAGVGILPVTFNTDGTQTVTATDTVDSSITGQSNTVVVSTPLQVDHFEVDAPTTAAAGSPFDFTVTAKDASNATVTTYGGTVHVTSSTPGTLPADATLTNGVGTFSATFTTATAISLTATDTVDSSITGSDIVTVMPGAAVTLDVDAPSTAANGAPITVEVAAKDVYGNTATGYSGTVAFTSSDPAADLPANTTLTFGYLSTSATLNTDGTRTITATDTVTASITGVSGNIAVSSVPVGPATHFVVSATSTMTAGGIVDVQVTAQDANNATATGYAGTVHISTDDATATTPLDATLTNGVGTFTVIVRDAGTTTITATDNAVASINGSDTVLVTPGAATAFTLGAPGSATVGTSVDITVTAKDTYDNVATGYAGTVELSSSDAGATLPADFTLVAGTATVPVTFATAGSQDVTATDTVSSSVTGTTPSIMVAGVPAGPTTHFQVSTVPTATAGDALTVSVTALDASNVTTTAYAGTVHITTSDAGATVPADATLVNGVGSFTVTLRTAGVQGIAASDTIEPSIVGTSGSVVVTPAATDHLVVAGPATATNGSPVGITVSSFDTYDNATPGYAGTVTIDSTDGSATLPADATLVSGAKVFSVTFNTNGSFTVTATDTVTASITGTSGAVVVSDAPPAPATHFSVSGPATAVSGTSFNVTVTALDASEQIASAYAGTVHLTSTDAGAVLPADVTLVNGVGILSVTLATAGDQTVTATDTVSASITGTSATIAVADPAAPPEVTLDKGTVEAGGTIQVEGSGFTPGEQVEVWFHSDPVLLATVAADAAGHVSYLAHIPADAPAGTHHIELVGLSSAVEVVSAGFTVTVAADPTTTTTTTTVPGSTSTTVPAEAVVTFGAVVNSAASGTTTTTSSGTLPVTGAAVTGLVAAGLLLLVSGLVVLGSARRRRS